jgi:signal transduction histidine kinase
MLVSFLLTRREVILNSWRTVCEQDPLLAKVSAMSREEFNNLLPLLLDLLEQRLLGQPLKTDPIQTATEHGLHRWQKAHTLLETMQELHHLTQILYAQIKAFQELFPQTETGLLLEAHRQVAQLMSETIQGSLQKADELQRLEAVSRAATLQQAVDQMQAISRQRGDLLRTSSHDLRGGFGIISSAAYLLQTEGLDQEERAQFMDMLSRNLGNVKTMLDKLMDLSRLEAGVDPLQLEQVDVAGLLNELVRSAQAMATERGLVLSAAGPDVLVVETDRVKLQRVIQNLLLNALTYTSTGFVSVSWSSEGNTRWVCSVQDSGAGLPDNLTSVLASQLKPVVEPTSTVALEEARPVAVRPSGDQQLPDGSALAAKANPITKGEGIGLHIVKRLSELLQATLEIETSSDRGTLVRLRMPVRHSD